MADETKRKFSVKSTADYEEHLLENWPATWPRKENRVVHYDVTLKQYRILANLISKKAGEREIEKYLKV